MTQLEFDLSMLVDEWNAEAAELREIALLIQERADVLASVLARHGEVDGNGFYTDSDFGDECDGLNRQITDTRFYN